MTALDDGRIHHAALQPRDDDNMSDALHCPVIAADGVDHGDPFVLAFEGHFYLYHSGPEQVPVYESTDLLNWASAGIALSSAGAPEWAACEYWAPEVIHQDGIFYMYVAGTTRLPGGRGDDGARRIGVARSTNPVGPFVLDAQPLIDHWSIDAHPFCDDDGSWWLFYNVRTDETRYVDGTIGCGNAVDQLLLPDTLAGEETVILTPDERWEGNSTGTWYWNEGAWVVRRSGVLFQIYSGGFFEDKTYGLGLAVADHPRGPWTKDAANPLFVSTESLIGPGHNSLVLGPDGVTTYIVFHARTTGREGRAVFVERFEWVGDRFRIGGAPTAETPTVAA